MPEPDVSVLDLSSAEEQQARAERLANFDEHAKDGFLADASKPGTSVFFVRVDSPQHHRLRGNGLAYLIQPFKVSGELFHQYYVSPAFFREASQEPEDSA